MEQQKVSVVLNGMWGRILSGIILASVLAGASGLVVAFRMSYAADAMARELNDHETRLRSIEGDLGEMKVGIRILLERTKPVPLDSGAVVPRR